jgi:hypothetical protein
MGYFDESVPSTSSPLSVESLNTMMEKVYEQNILPTIAVMHPRQYHSLEFALEGMKQSPMWNKIGRNILPWIPTTQRRLRARRRKIREGLAEFLLHRGIIEIPSDWEW